ncbi:MAG: preprotein translocase subunit SecE [Myxococcota bacterium]|jgi:preprotein translocase subunit SecE
MNPNLRYVYGALTALAILLWITIAKASAAVMGWVNLNDRPLLGSQFTVSTLIGMAVTGAALYLFLQNKRSTEVSLEVVTELKRVTWPDRQETVAATIVVIVTVFIISIILGVFDLVWSRLTNFIYQ